MQCKTLRQFRNRFSRLLNKAFDQEMYQRFILTQAMLDDGESLIEKFKSTMDMFGDEQQIKAYNQLIELIKDNPQYASIA